MSTDKANVEVEIAKSNNHTMFVPAFIDEYGFSPAQFRIFARIMRRSLGGNGQGCYETVQRLSLNLGISKRIVQESLKILRLAGCIKVLPREGTSSIITFQPCEKWVTKTKFDEIVFKVTGKRLQRDNERKMTRSGNATPSGLELPPSAETHHEGIPIKDIPKNKEEVANANTTTPIASSSSATKGAVRDQRAAHPAIVAIRELTNKFPDKLLWDKIITRFGTDIDIPKLTACRVEWIERGFNRSSVKWLNWYFDGIPTRTGANNESYRQQRTNDKIAETNIIAELRQKVANGSVSRPNDADSTRQLRGISTESHVGGQIG